MQNQKGNNQIHRIYKEKLYENKLKRNQFLEILKQLPQLKQFNNNKCSNLSDTQTKYNLGLLHLYQLINLFQLVDQNQSSQAPFDLASILVNYQLSQLERIRLVIQQLIDAQNLQSKGIVETNSPFVLVHHRLISEAIIKLRPQIFFVGIILFEDQNLTETLRALYQLNEKDYQNLLKFTCLDQKILQPEGINIKNQDYSFQIQNAGEVASDKNELIQMDFDHDYHLFEIKLENRKEILQKISEIPFDQQILQEKFDQTQKGSLFPSQNYKYIQLQCNQFPDGHENKNSNEEEEDFLTKQRTRIYNQVINTYGNVRKRKSNTRINWKFENDQNNQIVRQKNREKKKKK